MEEYYSIEQEFFSWPIEVQYDYVTLEANRIPAATTFYNRAKVISLGIRNDERIPFLEDTPKWISLLKAGVHFDFINKTTVKYRVSDSSLMRKTPEKFLKSHAKAYIYYRFPNDFKKRSKKQAVLKWLRAQRTIHDNALFWRMLCKAYRIIVNAK